MTKDLKDLFEELNNRKIISNYANLDNFYNLNLDERIIYLGIDCTNDSLHIGHLFLLIQTIRFANNNFKILLILGGSTSKIGDPSDKKEEREKINNDKINEYQEKIKKQLINIFIASKNNFSKYFSDFSPLEEFYEDDLLNKIYDVLEIDNKLNNKYKWEIYKKYIWPLENNNYVIINNKKWLEKIKLIDFIEEIGNVSINYLLDKDWIKKRLEKGGLSYSSLTYTLLQSKDFIHLYKNYKCRGQLGGSDQWGNLTTGLKLIKNIYKEKNKSFAFSFSLLTDKDGEKISKTKTKKYLLNCEKKLFKDYFQNMTDEEAEKNLRKFTFLSEDKIEKIIKLNNPKKLRIPQRILYQLIFWINSENLS